MKINLDHVWFMIQRSLQVMLKQPTGGKIITIGSMASYFGCNHRACLHRNQGRCCSADQERCC